MISITDEITDEKCVGCGSCANYCPQGAISMKADKLTGFFFPNVNNSLCVDCKKCYDACPIYKKECKQKIHLKDRAISAAYVAQNMDDQIRYRSTSGGMFSAFATTILRMGGSVFGAGFDDKMDVKHMEIADVCEIDKIRRSKYVQSDLGNSYKIIEERLNDHKKVLFVGTPCQVAGLYSYLGKEYSELFTIEFICLGVNSPLAYRAWLQECEEVHGSKSRNVWFKYKCNGWRDSPFFTRIDYDNGETDVLDEKNNYYMKGYLQGSFFVRSSCSKCVFTGTERCADIIFGDYWGNSQDDDNMGTSVVLVNSENGKNLFESIQNNMNYECLDLENVISNNPRLNIHLERNEFSKNFFLDLQRNPFSVVVKRYIGEDDYLSDIVTKIIKPKFLTENPK